MTVLQVSQLHQDFLTEFVVNNSHRLGLTLPQHRHPTSASSSYDAAVALQTDPLPTLSRKWMSESPAATAASSTHTHACLSDGTPATALAEEDGTLLDAAADQRDGLAAAVTPHSDDDVDTHGAVPSPQTSHSLPHDGLLEVVRRCTPDPAAYAEQLAQGAARARAILGPTVPLKASDWDVIPSPPIRFRLRSKFGWDAKNKVVTVGPWSSPEPAGDFLPGTARMNDVLTQLGECLADGGPLERGVFQIIVHTAHGTDDTRVRLVYRKGALARSDSPCAPATSEQPGQSTTASVKPSIKPLTKAERLRAARARQTAAVSQSNGHSASEAGTTESEWREAASAFTARTGITLCAVAKGIVWDVGKRELSELLTLDDGSVLHYRQVPGSFSNPNGAVNTRVLQWLRQQCSLVLARTSCPPQPTSPADVQTQPTTGGVDAVRDGWDGGAREGGPTRLLELYNGCGNHTVALAPLFDAVVAVEADPALVEAARANYALNGVCVCMPLLSQQPWCLMSTRLSLLMPHRHSNDLASSECVQLSCRDHSCGTDWCHV